MTLSRLGGSFHPIACAIFTKIDSNCSDSAAFYALVQSLGASIAHLSVDCSVLPNSCACAMVTHCTGLRHLSMKGIHDDYRDMMNFLGDTFPTVITSLGPQLEVLEVKVNHTLDRRLITTIAMNCLNLKRLRIFCSFSEGPLLSIWKQLGGSLCEIELRLELSVAEYENIGLYCKSITRLSFSGSNYQEKSVAIEELCLQYGHQLEFVHIPYTDLSPPSLSRIVAACPNIEIDTTGRDVAMNSMLAMGKTARNLVVDCNRFQSFAEETDLRRVGEVCSNLRVLNVKISEISGPEFRALLETPKPRLVHIGLYGRGAARTGVVLQALIEKVDSLQSISYEGYMCPPVTILESLVAANPNLREVKMRSYGTCECDPRPDSAPQINPLLGTVVVKTEELGLYRPQIVRALVKSPNLRSLDFSCSWNLCGKRVAGIAEASMPGRLGHVAVSVCGLQYL